jgi:hypothetical protein
MDETQQDQSVQLLIQQLGRFQDRISARMDRIEESIRHHSELEAEKTTGLRSDLAALRTAVNDHETRIRAATDGITVFKTWSGLASSGSTVMSIVALVKSFLGI